MGDLISRSRLKEELKSWAWIITKPNYYSRTDADFVIDSQAAVDAVEVVRCEDCKHRKEKTCFHPCGGMWVGVVLKDDDFCSHGERKDNG